MNRSRTSAICLLCGISSLICGCLAISFRISPSAVIKTYYSYLDKGEIANAQALLSRSTVESISSRNLEAALRQDARWLARKGGLESILVTEEVVWENKAHVDYDLHYLESESISRRNNVVKDVGVWKMNQGPSLIVLSFYGSLVRGDTDQALELLARSATEGISAQELESAVSEEARLLAERGGLDSIITNDESITDGNATIDFALYYADDEPDLRCFELVKEEGLWKLFRGPAIVVRQFYELLEQGKVDVAKELLSEETLEDTSALDLEDTLENLAALLAEHDGLASLEILEESPETLVQAEVTVLLHFNDRESDERTFILIKENNAWKITFKQSK